LTAVARWEKYDARTGEMRAVDCPMAVATALVDRGRWRLHELVAYVETPTVREDGTPITEPGYDAVSGLYLLPESPRVTLPKRPDHAAAVAARDMLASAVGSWPYVEPDDHAAAVAMIMTVMVARSVDAVPMSCVTAPTPGTGKSLLVDAAAIIATGRRASVISLGKDEAEASKRMAAGLLAGDCPLAADNVEAPLGGELLCQAITQPWLSTRPLGTSNSVRVPARTALLATGNNLVIRGDLTRRVMVIRLDAGIERPETREFAGDVLAEIGERRAELVSAALTITLAYHAAGCPAVDAPPVGGFGPWDRLVRRPLIWAGLPDPMGPAASVRDDDPDRAAMVGLLTAMHEVYIDRTVTAAQIVDDATRAAPRFDGSGVSYDHPALHEAVHLVCGGKQLDARRLGYALRRYRGRIAEGLRLVGAGRCGPSKAIGWTIEQMLPPATTRG
jgi:putative DNA primase/helicase